MAKLKLQLYSKQKDKWPRSGRHLLAQFDKESVVVYQAYGETIGRFAANHGYFGDDFSVTRMSWIKPSFLWMMSRSAWAMKPGQEKVLAVRLRRPAFDEILRQATPADVGRATPDPRGKAGTKLSKPPVVFQWDPDRDPFGNKLERRTIQLGLRGDALKQYARTWLAAIDDITELVVEGRNAIQSSDLSRVLTPIEDPYPIEDPTVGARLRLSLT